MLIGWIIISSYTTIILANIFIDIGYFIDIYIKSRRKLLVKRNKNS